MKGKGEKAERETIINFNEADDMASIWTASEIVYRKLRKRLGTDHLTQDGERHAIFEFPKKWLVLPRKRVQRELTEAQVAKLRDSMSKMHTGLVQKRAKSIPEGV